MAQISSLVEEGRYQTARRQLNLLPYILLAPTLIAISLVFLYPAARVIQLSVFKTDHISIAGAPYVGLENFGKLYSSERFWSSLLVTLKYTMGTMIGTVLLGLGAALLMNQHFPGRSLARSALILPWAVPQVVVVLIWIWIFDPQYGILNYGLTVIGLDKFHNLRWVSNPSLALLTVIVVTVWKLYPFATLMFLAGLQSIPRTYYEAAQIDGAGQLRIFLDVTLPGLRHVTRILVLLLTVWSFGYFVFIWLITAGGPGRGTETLAIQTYLQAFKFFRASNAATLGVTLLLITLFLAGLYMTTVRKGQEVRA